MNLQQAKDTIENRINAFYKQVIANVRLADSYVTVLGEVGKPGRYLMVYDDKISIFALLGMAGDLTYDANRENIKIIREIDGISNVSYINIAGKNIIESDYYYLMPNDIVYIEPLNAVFLGQRNFPFISTLSLVISTTTSIILLFNFLK